MIMKIDCITMVHHLGHSAVLCFAVFVCTGVAVCMMANKLEEKSKDRHYQTPKSSMEYY